MDVRRETGRRFVIAGETITTRRVADGDRLARVLGSRPRRRRPKYSAEIEELAAYMTRGYHDWSSGGRYHVEPGFRHLIGQPDHRLVTVHFAGLRDDWEDDCQRAFDAWSTLGFQFAAVDVESADIVVDDEKPGAYALLGRRWARTGHWHAGMPVVHTAAREINISQLWPEWDLYDALLHEIGHTLGLGHPGPYNGAGRWQPASAADSSNHTIMSYFGQRPCGRLGDADRLAIDLIYG